MLGVRAISCICITRFAERKGAVVFEAKILSVDLKMKTMKYLSFIPETRELADTSLPVECHTSTCGNRQINYRPGLLEAWLALLNHR